MRTLTISVACILLATTLVAGTPAKNTHPRVVLATALGDIVLELYPEKAPVTVANFLRYVDEDRFTSSTFYRVVRLDNQPDKKVKIEVIQGGLSRDDDHVPNRLPPIAHETTKVTGLRHRDGTLSMARNDPGSASSEFFICIGNQPELDFGGKRNPDGQGFAAFGRVVKGMDVVRAIQKRKDKGQMLEEPVAFTAKRAAN